MNSEKLSIDDLLQGRTLEETVDHALRAVVKQGKISAAKGQCYYRHPDDSNVRCVVGHMIPDNLYSDHIDNGGSKDLYCITVPSEHQDLLYGLQFCHDDADTVDEMLDKVIGYELSLDAELGYPWLKPLVQRIIDDKAAGRL